MAAKQTPKEGSENKPSTPSKADFIRGLAGMPAKEVVAKAKDAGITISDAYVYKLRSSERIAAAKGPSGQKTASTKPASGKPGSKKPAPKQAASTKVVPGVKAGEKKSAPTSGAAPAAAQDSSLEERFVDLALDLGLARAEEIFIKLRARVKRLVLS
jgi:hypothetical protein